MCLLSITRLVLMSLTQKGTTVTLITKTSKRYEGVIASTESEGDTTGVTLRDVKELGVLNAPIKSPLFIASTNIESCMAPLKSGPLNNGPGGGGGGVQRPRPGA
jgi:hypothetical protein